MLLGIPTAGRENHETSAITLTLRFRPSLGPWALRRRLCSSGTARPKTSLQRANTQLGSRSSHRVYSCFPIRIRICWVATSEEQRHWLHLTARTAWHVCSFLWIFREDEDGDGDGALAVEQLHSWKSKARRSMVVWLWFLTVADWSEDPSGGQFRRALQRFLITNWILLVCLRPHWFMIFLPKEIYTYIQKKNAQTRTGLL